MQTPLQISHDGDTGAGWEAHVAVASVSGFVHDRLPSRHHGCGSWFIHRADWDRPGHHPRVRVIVDEDSTTIHGWILPADDGYSPFEAKFTSDTPSLVIAAAITGVLEATGIE